MTGRWSNGRRKLTAHQELVFRTIFAEELETSTPADALREAERYMNEDALPDWKQFWIDWNAPPGPLEALLGAAVGLTLISAIVRNADQLSPILQETTRPLAYLLHDAAS